MVRYRELVENIDKKNIRTILAHDFQYTGEASIDDKGLITIGNCQFFGREYIPIKFAESRNFICSRSLLKSLNGCPHTVWGDFECVSNSLTDLVGGPIGCNQMYYAHRNPLKSLEGLPQYVKKSISIDYSTTLPLLRLLTLSCRVDIGHINLDDTINEIINRHIRSKIGLRQRILACQKELLDNGFEGNASW